MAYNDFTLDAVKRQFGLDIREQAELYAALAPVPVSDRLRETLAENVPLAVAVGTEKARSEFIVAPILSEIRRRTGHPLSLFSGVEFNVDLSKGLGGFCDFLLSLSPLQLIVEAPVVAIVEANKDNINSGLGQCLAEMVAAQTFNAQRGNAISTVHGVVTTGSLWKFLSLTGVTATVDEREYPIDHVERILGILLAMVTPLPPDPSVHP